MSNSIVYDAFQHPVHSVTVFQVNRADVNRRLNLDLKKGQNEVEVKNLPNVLDEDSIRVDGIGKAVIFDVIYKSPPVTTADHDSEEVAELTKKRDSINREIEVLDKQNSVLEKYSGSLDSHYTKSDQLTDFLDVYAKRSLGISEKLAELRVDVAEVNKKLEAANKVLLRDDESKKRGVRIIIIVLAEEDGPAELSLTYGVENASWTPLYDLRADIDSNSEKGSTGSKIDLHYRASIFQSTAEDWKDVNLTLSTASPQIGSAIPKLTATRLAEETQVFYRAARSKSKGGLSFGSNRQAMSDTLGPQMMMRSSALLSDAYSSPPPFVAHTQARASDQGQGFSSTFGIEGLSTIPSDTKDSSEKHRVTISVVQLQNVELEWVAVPKEIASVFLKCKVKNTSEFTFLPGDANIFMNNNFVAKSDIPTVSPQESFSCSLGVDSSVRVTYHPQSKRVKTPTGGLLSTKTVTTAYSQRITVKNTRRQAIGRLIVKDQVPVSSDARIKVAITDPLLPEAVKGAGIKELGITKATRIRWVPANEDEDDVAAEANQVGLLEWISRVEGGSSVDFNLAWEVNTPHSLKVAVNK